MRSTWKTACAISRTRDLKLSCTVGFPGCSFSSVTGQIIKIRVDQLLSSRDTVPSISRYESARLGHYQDPNQHP
jgi:hypothetical protein